MCALSGAAIVVFPCASAHCTFNSRKPRVDTALKRWRSMSLSWERRGIPQEELEELCAWIKQKKTHVCVDKSWEEKSSLCNTADFIVHFIDEYLKILRNNTCFYRHISVSSVLPSSTEITHHATCQLSARNKTVLVFSTFLHTGTRVDVLKWRQY